MPDLFNIFNESYQIQLDLDSALIIYPKKFEKESDLWINKLKSQCQWEQKHIIMFGKKVLEPRLVCWYGDEECSYTYSKTIHRPQAWNSILTQIREEIFELTKIEMNSVLCNWYRNGQDSMGHHSDNEKELGDLPEIISLSLGACRTILFKNKTTKKLIRIELQNGDLIVMRGKTQDNWTHAIPKRTGCKEERINLTFRKIIQAS